MRSTDSSATLQRMGAETAIGTFDAAVLPIVGRLDADAGVRLLEEARAALGEGAVRIHVDLCEVTAFTAAGAAALLACRDLPPLPAAGSDAGPPCVEVHYRTSRGPGRDALLAAFAGVDDTGGDRPGEEHDDPFAIDLRTT
ncbi:MAG: hypothetical protein AB7H43_05040 [Acidimicrobiia bacterium]